MDKTTVLRARALIGERTPLQSDCGKLCGAACCQPDEDGQGGICLLYTSSPSAPLSFPRPTIPR